MAFAEALAHRLPVVGVAAGAVPGVVPARAGILVRPGRIDLLARALRRMLGPQRRRFALNAAALRFPEWPRQAAHLSCGVNTIRLNFWCDLVWTKLKQPACSAASTSRSL
jgi:hypothetical protein